MKSPTVLIILDGFGYRAEKQCNAIAQAHTPTLDYLMAHYPHAFLAASGSAVGLPEGFEGNSEVGHITIGAGRRIPSPCLQLLTAIKTGEFFANPILTSHLNLLTTTQKTLHIMGILSSSGSQGHEELIYAAIKAALDRKVTSIMIHAFLDGRDIPPQSAAPYLQRLQMIIARHPQVQLVSITGRSYAMDRDAHWDLTQATYKMLTQSHEAQFASWQDALSYYYAQKITDEFIPPTRLTATAIRENDGVIFTNFREDRARQLAACFINPQEVPLQIKPFPLAFFISAIRYASHFNNPILCEVVPASGTLKELLSREGKTIVSIAETEKYAHITYFFSDGHEQPFPGEKQLLIPSLGLQNYASHPAMSAPQITAALGNSLHTNPADFYLINYANADMVGHSGDLEATIKAVQCLDAQLKEVYELVVKKMKGTLYITADHGNAELKCDLATGQPYTGHTTNPVPFIWIKNDLKDQKINLELYELADIASFILKEMDE